MGWLRHGWSRETDTWTPQEMTNVTFGNLHRNVSFSHFSLLLSANVVGAQSVSSFSHFQKKNKPALLLTITEFPPGGKSAWFAIYNHDMSAHTTDS